ncbi:MAG: hypothetical protein HY702_00570 [Gemmatimonadetes bacterium]|nr:hypothetical protein [Gemmatimonadota bacterium]
MIPVRVWKLVCAAPLLFALACGERQRSAEEAAAAERELELAIRRDTPAVALADTALLAQPKPAPRPAPRPAPKPAPRPASKPRAPEPSAREVLTPPPAEPTTTTAAVGTTLDVLLDQEISTETQRPGDRFTAKLAADVASPGGGVLIPAGAEVEGEVAAVQASKGASRQATITLAFHSLSFEGRTYPLRASVVSAEVKTRRTTGDAEQAAKILGGAAAGAVLGKVLGKDAKSTIIGAAAGAAAGTAIALGTADYAGVIPAGGKLTLKLDEPLEVVIR